MHTLRARDAEAVTFFCLNDVFKPRKLKPSQFPAVIGRQVVRSQLTTTLPSSCQVWLLFTATCCYVRPTPRTRPACSLPARLCRASMP